LGRPPALGLTITIRGGNKALMSAARIPSGPKAHFLLGNLPEFRRDPLSFLSMCARDYGDVVLIRVAHLKAYILNHPDYIEEVLVTKNRSFIKDRTLRRRPFRLFFGNGLLTSEGDQWLRERRLAQPAFHRDRLAVYAQAMVSYAERMMDNWRDGEIRDVHRDMMRLTLEILTNTLFDTDVARDAEEVAAALEIVMDRFAPQGSLVRILDNYLPTLGWIRFQKAVRRLDEIIYRMTARRRNRNEDRGDLLSMLLSARDEDGSGMTDQQLRDEILTLLLAGHETTALALSWAWYLLAQHPKVEAKLVEELQSMLGGRPPAISDLPRLRYAESIIKESMRLYPPAWNIGRQAVSDTEIGGYCVPAGTQVYLSQWAVHRDPRYYDNPEEFNPGRWTDGLEKRLPKYAYFPFGGGPRLCIGNSFAMMEAVMLLASIAQRFQLVIAPSHTVTVWPSLTLRPKRGIRVVLHRR